MKKNKEQTFSSVLSINPYTQEYYQEISSLISKVETPEYIKDQYVVSFISAKDIIYGQISVSKNFPEEDIYDHIYTKAYEELVLDQAIEYNIQIIESFHQLDEENKNYHVFIIDPEKLESIFKETVEKVKYIDLILPEPLLIKQLYTKEIISTNGVDCFIYIHEKDASITLYKDKEFLYTKPIKYSMEEIHERFCELYGERIPYDDFVEFIQTQNLKYSTSPYLQTIIKLYKEIFANINDVLTYVKRAFDLDKIEKIYIGSSIYFESKLDEILEAEIGIKTANFEFDYGLESEENYIDQIHALLYIYTTISDDSQKYIANFTLYPRPPKFFQRESGKLISLIVASFIIAFIYPVTYWILGYAQGLQLDILKDEYKELHNIRVTREATIKNKKADLEKATKLLAEEKSLFTQKKGTLVKIQQVKNNYLFKAAALTDFTKDLNRHRVKLESLEYTQENNKKTFILHLVSARSSRITQLLKDVTVKYSNQYSFEMDKIYYDKESKVYFSTLKAIKL